MLCIDRIALREIHLALKEPFRISSGMVRPAHSPSRDRPTRRRRHLGRMRRVQALPNYTPETIDTAWLAIREWLAPRLLGRSIDGPDVVHDLLAENIRGHNMAKAALEWAPGASRPRCSSAAHEAARGDADRVPTGISLGIQSAPERLVERARGRVDAGYERSSSRSSRRRTSTMCAPSRRALGDDVEIMADANAAYTIADLDHLAQLDEFHLIMLEQPLGADDLLQLAELQRRMKTPLCFDESITDLERARAR